MFHVSFSSHQIALFGTVTPDDSGGRDEKCPMGLSDQFTII
jgi:hypothetical protein